MSDTDGKAELLWPEKEIESLRQRVKELEEYICNDVRDMKIELAESQQRVKELESQLLTANNQTQFEQSHGEPVYYEITTHDGIKWVGENPNNLPNHISKPLYFTPPTCFSAGDMADAQAKAFRDGLYSARTAQKQLNVRENEEKQA